MDWLEVIWRFLGRVWSFICDIPGFLFGDSLDSGWGIMFVIYVIVATIAFVISTISLSIEWFRGWDVDFSEAKLEEVNKGVPEDEQHKVNLTLAREQQVMSLRFTVPFAGMVLASLYAWAHSFTWIAYAIFAAAWLAFGLLLLRPWWVATVVWSARKLYASGVRVEHVDEAYSMTVPGAFAHYMRWGLSGSKQRRRRMFVLRLRRLNKIVSALRLRWVKLRLLEPLMWWLFVAAIWPVGMVIAVSHMSLELWKKSKRLRPDWAKSPSAPTYTGRRVQTPKTEKAEITEAPAEV